MDHDMSSDMHPRDRTQHNTFVRWVNLKLIHARPSSVEVSNLSVDLMDGVNLCKLVEVLTRKTLPYKPSPTNEFTRVNNVSMALDALTEDGLQLINIHPSSIAKTGSVTQVLGLVWQMILHYQLFTVDYDYDYDNPPSNDDASESDTDMSDDERSVKRKPRPTNIKDMRSALIEFVNAKIATLSPEQHQRICESTGRDVNADTTVTNLESNWQDGYVLCGLVAACGDNVDSTINSIQHNIDISETCHLPTAVEDKSNLAVNKSYHALASGMGVADSEQQIPQLVGPVDMLLYPESQAIMAYVSYFSQREQNRDRERNGSAKNTPMMRSLGDSSNMSFLSLETVMENEGEDGLEQANTANTDGYCHYCKNSKNEDLVKKFNEQEILLNELMAKEGAWESDKHSKEGMLNDLQAELDSANESVSEMSELAMQMTEERDEMEKERDDMKAERDIALEERDQMKDERDSALKERDEIRVERDNLIIERDGLKVEKDVLNEENTLLKTERDELKVERDALAEENVVLKTERDELKVERDALKTEVVVVKEERDALLLENTQIKAQRDELEAERDALTIERDQLKKERDELQTERDVLLEEKKEWLLERQELLDEIERLKKLLRDNDILIASLSNSDVINVTITVSDLADDVDTSEIDALNQTVQDHLLTIASLQKDLDTMTDKYNQAEEDLVLLAEQHQVLSDTHNTLTEEHAGLTSDHLTLTQNHDDLTNKYDVLHKAHEELIEKHSVLTEDYSVLNDKHCVLEGEVQILKNDKDMLSEKCRVLTEENVVLTGEKEVLSGENDKLTAENNDLTEKYQKLIEQFETLTEKHDVVVEEFEVLVASHKELTEKHQDVVDLLEAMTEQFNTLTVEHDNLGTKYQDLLKQLEDLSNQHSDLIVQHDDLNEKYNDLLNQLNESITLHDQVNDKYEALLRDFDELTAQHNNLKDQHNTVVNEYQTVVEDNETLRQEFTELELVHLEKQKELQNALDNALANNNITVICEKCLQLQDEIAKLKDIIDNLNKKKKSEPEASDLTQELLLEQSRNEALRSELATYKERTENEIADLTQLTLENQNENDDLQKMNDALVSLAHLHNVYDEDYLNSHISEHSNTNSRSDLIQRAQKLLSVMKPQVGITITETTDDIGGVRIAKVVVGKAAYNAGLKEGEIIEQVNGVDINNNDEFGKEFGRVGQAGNTVSLQVYGERDNGDKYMRNIQIEVGSKHVGCNSVRELRRIAGGVVKPEDSVLVSEIEAITDNAMTSGQGNVRRGVSGSDVPHTPRPKASVANKTTAASAAKITSKLSSPSTARLPGRTMTTPNTARRVSRTPISHTPTPASPNPQQTPNTARRVSNMSGVPGVSSPRPRPISTAHNPMSPRTPRRPVTSVTNGNNNKSENRLSSALMEQRRAEMNSTGQDYNNVDQGNIKKK